MWKSLWTTLRIAWWWGRGLSENSARSSDGNLVAYSTSGCRPSLASVPWWKMELIIDVLGLPDKPTGSLSRTPFAVDARFATAFDPCGLCGCTPAACDNLHMSVYDSIKGKGCGGCGCKGD